ncbi:sialic acid-binding Ig-like lectin 14 [Anabas testudineus]|uniref:sialic acid-binding Ig-like lectin 14 n=1 Tax=Anabas testudineus TaxID=64144 RepID=UPI000E460C04|nr:sialic acid-binding Ig-like lectin 14 [Anabas testudineus]
MFVLIWVALVFCVRGNKGEAEATSSSENYCQTGSYCINLIKGEITAETGLCVVLPCSFTTKADFSVKEFIWFKCNSATKEKCDKPEVAKLIFNSSNNENIEPEFKRRVSLLEPDVSKKNCSIIINHLRESDSGSYQLRVNGNRNGNTDGFTFTSTATITVTGINSHNKYFSQKPTVTVPPLIEGHQTTLTCIAPGLCSGSVPEITWTWRKPGENDSHIPGNITEISTETLTAVTQRHSSTLTFNTSAEHHNTEVTCKVNFNGSKTTEETVTLNVISPPKILNGSGCMNQSHVLTCVCISQGVPLPTITWSLLNIKYSVFNTVSQHTVNSSLTAPLTTSSRTTIEFTLRDLLNNSWLHVIVAFLLGILLSATIIYCRKKQKCSEDLAEYVEIATTRVATGQEVEDDWTHDHPGESAPADDDVEVEAQYSNIDFSLLKRKNPTEVKKRETTETEYTEIKKETTCERQYNGGEEGDMLEVNGAITDEDKETEQCILAIEEGGEDVALYSTVNKVLHKI